MNTEYQRPTIVIFNRYCLAEQFNLATEFSAMMRLLSEEADVVHMSFKGPQGTATQDTGIHVEELPLRIDRTSARDILVKTALSYLVLPWAGLRLRRLKPDLVFLCECFPLWVTIIKLFSGCKISAAYGDWHFHNILGSRKGMRPVLKFLEAIDRFEVKQLHGFFCRARTAAEQLVRKGVPEDHICVVRDAPDLTAFYPQDQARLRQRCGFGEEDVVLLYHGVMHQGKGLDLLIQWVSELHEELPGIGLMLVGDGPEREALQARSRALGIDSRVYFTGWLETIKLVGEYCNAADICVAMRTADRANEHIVPGALLHCMACRKVVVGPRLPGISEIIREADNGFMFNPDDGNDFKKLILRLSRTREDWTRVTESAYADIKANYTVEATSAQYAAALKHFASI